MGTMGKIALEVAARMSGAVGLPVLGVVFLSAAMNVAPGLFFKSGEDHLRERDVAPEILKTIAPDRNVYVYSQGFPGGFFQHLHQASYEAERILRDPGESSPVRKFINAADIYFRSVRYGHDFVLAYALAPAPGQGEDCFISPLQRDWKLKDYKSFMSGLLVSDIANVPSPKDAFDLTLFLHEVGHCPQPYRVNPSQAEIQAEESEADVAGVSAYVAATGDDGTVRLIKSARAVGALALRPGGDVDYDDSFHRATALAFDAAEKGEPLPSGEDVIKTYKDIERKVLGSPIFYARDKLPYALRVVVTLHAMRNEEQMLLTPMERRAVELYLEGVRYLAPKAFERAIAPLWNAERPGQVVSPSL